MRGIGPRVAIDDRLARSGSHSGRALAAGHVERAEKLRVLSVYIGRREPILLNRIHGDTVIADEISQSAVACGQSFGQAERIPEFAGQLVQQAVFPPGRADGGAKVGSRKRIECLPHRAFDGGVAFQRYLHDARVEDRTTARPQGL